MPLEGPTILEATTGLSFLQNAPVQPSNTSSPKLISMQHLLHVPSEVPSIRMHSAQKLILHACTRWLVQKDSSNEVLAVPARVLSLGSECSFLIFLPCTIEKKNQLVSVLLFCNPPDTTVSCCYNRILERSACSLISRRSPNEQTTVTPAASGNPPAVALAVASAVASVVASAVASVVASAVASVVAPAVASGVAAVALVSGHGGTSTHFRVTMLHVGCMLGAQSMTHS